MRAEFYDGSGTLQKGTEARLDYELEYTPDGGVAVDADELLDLVIRAIDGALERVGDARVSGAAMSTFWHSVIGLDRDGRPTTPVLYWADRRAASAARSCANDWTRPPSTAARGACSTPATGPPSFSG